MITPSVHQMLMLCCELRKFEKYEQNCIKAENAFYSETPLDCRGSKPDQRIKSLVDSELKTDEAKIYIR